jgi:hypothetical protein
MAIVSSCHNGVKFALQKVCGQLGDKVRVVYWEERAADIRDFKGGRANPGQGSHLWLICEAPKSAALGRIYPNDLPQRGVIPTGRERF